MNKPIATMADKSKSTFKIFTEFRVLKNIHLPPFRDQRDAGKTGFTRDTIEF